MAGTATCTLRVDPATAAPQATSVIGLGEDGGLAVGQDGVGVRSADRFLRQLDPGDAASSGSPTAGPEQPRTQQGAPAVG